jgi:hypothetical protein
MIAAAHGVTPKAAAKLLKKGKLLVKQHVDSSP